MVIKESRIEIDIIYVYNRQKMYAVVRFLCVFCGEAGTIAGEYFQ